MSWGAIGAMVGLGVGAGVVGGMFGIGGGLIIVPALVLAFGFDQKTATGTSLLAQLLPVAFLAVREFWRRGRGRHPKGSGDRRRPVFRHLDRRDPHRPDPAAGHEAGLWRVPDLRWRLFPDRDTDDTLAREAGRVGFDDDSLISILFSTLMNVD